ncbi:MAG TPA: hypothetical protein DEO56_12270 [Nitrosomonas nitrosa]|uniref:Uncharacterized protein n=1 Tax=Nitrosomonas nitrosa TaxID=52442 RepID=A0A1I4P806_9PROT|nr:hypothetical protein C8R30_11256 [Nitrosomonas nitrosa]SFM23994.1 hypothetical protein SAMN05421880_11041 [Nitrosomonas nitrosa]HBZ31343.1 hypothetical protein [Nitrosomonas nitrosa]
MNQINMHKRIRFAFHDDLLTLNINHAVMLLKGTNYRLHFQGIKHFFNEINMANSKMGHS